MKKIILSLCLVIIWMGVIYFLSSMESDKSQSKSFELTKSIITLLDKTFHVKEEIREKHQSIEFLEQFNYYLRRGAHVYEYFVLCILVFNLLFSFFKYRRCLYPLTFIISFIYACTDEFHQTFVSGRTGRIEDTFVDMLGVLFGCLYVTIIIKWYKKRKVD